MKQEELRGLIAPASNLCQYAKHGAVCPDDLCHGRDVTLCGFNIKKHAEEATARPAGFFRKLRRLWAAPR